MILELEMINIRMINMRTILLNGHCNIDHHSYKALFLIAISVSINKLVQIIMFVVYLFYFYKFKNICNVQISNVQYNWELFRIAIAMEATIGLSNFIWMFARFASEYLNIVIISGGILCWSNSVWSCPPSCVH